MEQRTLHKHKDVSNFLKNNHLINYSISSLQVSQCLIVVLGNSGTYTGTKITNGVSVLLRHFNTSQRGEILTVEL